jgi:hypothetical protein
MAGDIPHAQSREHSAPQLQDMPPGQPLTLAEAARLFLPEGALTEVSLKAEHRRGNLAIAKVGRAYFTTPADVMTMVEKCRVKAQARGCGSTKPEALGQSSTANVESALAALNIRLSKRSKRSKNT